MRLTIWTKEQLLRRLACLMALHLLLTVATAWTAVTLLLDVPHRRSASAYISCAEDAAIPASAMEESAVMEIEAVVTDDAAAAAQATPVPDDRTLRVEVIHASQPPKAGEKRILIYHTHTWEAFTQVKDAPYRETEKWRTKDNAANMVAVGNALTAALEALGFEVVHDTTAFEPPNLSTSYQRSLTMLEQRASDGESYDLYIDLHRDAFSSSSAIKRTVSAGGESLARLMVLIGKGEGYEQRPDWEANLSLAECLTQRLNAQIPELCRDVKVKTGRFNQHIAPHCVLIECGCNYNTLQEVLRSMPYLAEAIRAALLDEAQP